MSRTAFMLALLSSAAIVAPAAAQTPVPPPPGQTGSTSASVDSRDTNAQLEEVVVTAQKREQNVQTTPISITALSGASLAKDRILSIEDLGHSVTGLSFTQNSPQSNEINIRGVVNTRLSAPTADQSVSTFVDEVYVSRSGNLNSEFYDVGRIEVLRGPQGVLLGKNVAGGAINVISAAPDPTPSGRLTVTAGNYDLHQASGYITGPITPELLGRFSFQTINHSGYARDIVHNVDLENLNSIQLRGYLSFRPTSSDLRVDFISDYSKDSSNGINRVVTPSPDQTGLRPWSTARSIIAGIRGGLSERESLPVWPLFEGDTIPTPQGVRHKTFSNILKIQKNIGSDVLFTSITGYRWGNAFTLYDQTGVGPDNPYGVITTLLFAEPVNFIERARQFSQEVRLTSQYPDSRFDWILGAYYLHNKVHQFNRFWGESPYEPGGRPPPVLGSLSGESHWDDDGVSEDLAAFAQAGYKFTDQLKLEVGVRYTHDRKYGHQTGLAVATGDMYSPGELTPLTPLTVPYFSTDYSDSWSKVTPQATLSFQALPNLYTYLTVSTGFKGGGFQNDAPNALAAALPYDPESMTNYEAGYKWEFLDRRARWNTSVFYMKYNNLQVQQTSAACLCNIINNASSATIKGVETDFQIEPVRWFRAWVTGSALDATYDDFVDTNGVVDTGNFLQRTPKYQFGVGAEVTADIFGWPQGLRARINYKQQGKMFWAPDNLDYEDPYGLVDGRITITPAGQRFTVSAFVKNLGDKLYRTNIISFFGDEDSSYGAPRTFGVELSGSF